MSEKRLTVFIQDLKDTTTVLQQLEMCIKNLKSALSLIDSINLDDINERLNSIDDELTSLDERLVLINGRFDTKQDVMTASNGITIVDNDIRANTEVLATREYAQTIASQAVYNAKLYTHKSTFRVELRTGVTIGFPATILSSDSDYYTIDSLIEYINDDYSIRRDLKIPLIWTGDNYNDIITNLYYDSTEEKFVVMTIYQDANKDIKQYTVMFAPSDITFSDSIDEM